MRYRSSRRNVIILTLAALLSGCGITPQGQAVRSAIDEYGQKIADAELENTEFVLCRAITIGAFVRRYGTNQKKIDAWKTLCSNEVAAP